MGRDGTRLSRASVEILAAVRTNFLGPSRSIEKSLLYEGFPIEQLVEELLVRVFYWYILDVCAAAASHSHSSTSSNNIVGVHYRVGKKIGEGSFGVIFEGAADPRLLLSVFHNWYPGAGLLTLGDFAIAGTNLLNSQTVAIKFVCFCAVSVVHLRECFEEPLVHCLVCILAMSSFDTNDNYSRTCHTWRLAFSPSIPCSSQW